MVCQFDPYVISYLYYRKKHKHFSFSHFREVQSSVVSSVKVAMVVFLSLHHQQCDPQNTTGKHRVDRSHHFICDTTLPFCPLAPPLKACATLQWRPQGHVHCIVVFGPVDMAHSEKFPLYQRHLKKTNCWTCHLWILVWLRCDTSGSSSKPPVSSELLLLGAPAS